jgi:predicted nicotinamide N-methyase
LTIPNVILNADKKNINFYSGDWNALKGFINDKYNVILCSEVLYNQKSHSKLYNLIKNLLENDGVAFISTKSYYFGVGGGV